MILVDVRISITSSPEAISGCRRIPLHQLPGMVEELPRHCPIVLYCQLGQRSRAAAMYLREAGFQAFFLRGGLSEWGHDPHTPPQSDSTMENGTLWL